MDIIHLWQRIVKLWITCIEQIARFYTTNTMVHYFVLYVDHQTMYSEYCSKQFSEWMKWPLVQCQSCTHWLLYIYIVKTAIPIEANETLQQSEGTKIGQNMVNTFHKTICCSTQQFNTPTTCTRGHDNRQLNEIDGRDWTQKTAAQNQCLGSRAKLPKAILYLFIFMSFDWIYSEQMYRCNTYIVHIHIVTCNAYSIQHTAWADEFYAIPYRHTWMNHESCMRLKTKKKKKWLSAN